MALADVAFQKCLYEAASISEFVANYDRLTGGSLGRVLKASPLDKMIDKATGFQDEQMRKFCEFVHRCLYLTLPNEALHALRIGAMNDPEFEQPPQKKEDE
jgi:hypothetical protein